MTWMTENKDGLQKMALEMARTGKNLSMFFNDKDNQSKLDLGKTQNSLFFLCYPLRIYISTSFVFMEPDPLMFIHNEVLMYLFGVLKKKNPIVHDKFVIKIDHFSFFYST